MKVVKVTRSLFFAHVVFFMMSYDFVNSIYTSCFNEFMPGFQYFIIFYYINIKLRKNDLLTHPSVLMWF